MASQKSWLWVFNGVYPEPFDEVYPELDEGLRYTQDRLDEGLRPSIDLR